MVNFLQPTTPLPWTAKRSWEGYHAPDEDEVAAYQAQPYTRIEGPCEDVVLNAHDHFTFKPGDAEFIVHACNAHASLVQALEALMRTTLNADSTQAFQVHPAAVRVLETQSSQSSHNKMTGITEAELTSAPS